MEKKFRARIDYVICVGVSVLKTYIRIVVRLVSTVRMRCKLKKRRIKLNVYMSIMYDI